jgi:uncharacterized repeat protein (TIGR03803 family)
MGLNATLLTICTITLCATNAYAATEKLLDSFYYYQGENPVAPLIFDAAAGALYGTAEYGGAYNEGSVFEMTFSPELGWTEEALYSFIGNGSSGNYPYGPVILDAAGNLYGTTQAGGVYAKGTVFELTPVPVEIGSWSPRMLYSFNDNGIDGYSPLAGLTQDAAGNLYGTTSDGGRSGAGTVFELVRTTAGGFAEKVLYSFRHNSADGIFPAAGLIFDTVGNLYGTTTFGGTGTSYPTKPGCGTVFELSPNGSGGWTEKVLYSLDTSNGSVPYSGLILDAAGNLYGTTTLGGIYGAGTAFELTPAAGGSWTENVLYSFGAYSADGTSPYSGLIFDSVGNLYGTTHGGGAHSTGTAFELTPEVGGNWTETILHSFDAYSTDGGSPYGGLIFDSSGNHLYGTTFGGGDSNQGTVFEITP